MPAKQLTEANCHPKYKLSWSKRNERKGRKERMFRNISMTLVTDVVCLIR